MNEENKMTEPLISVVGMNPYLTQIQTICTNAMNCENFKYNEELYSWVHSMIGIILHKCDLTHVFEVIRDQCDNILANSSEFEEMNPDMIKYARNIRMIAADGDAMMKKKIREYNEAKLEVAVKTKARAFEEIAELANIREREKNKLVITVGNKTFSPTDCDAMNKITEICKTVFDGEHGLKLDEDAMEKCEREVQETITLTENAREAIRDSALRFGNSENVANDAERMAIKTIIDRIEKFCNGQGAVVTQPEEFVKLAQDIRTAHVEPFINILTEMLSLPDTPSVGDYERCLRSIQNICTEECEENNNGTEK